jgi:hypothetical protein
MKVSESKVNHRIVLSNQNGIKESTILICICSYRDNVLFNPMQVCNIRRHSNHNTCAITGHGAIMIYFPSKHNSSNFDCDLWLLTTMSEHECYRQDLRARACRHSQHLALNCCLHTTNHISRSVIVHTRSLAVGWIHPCVHMVGTSMAQHWHTKDLKDSKE